MGSQGYRYSSSGSGCNQSPGGFTTPLKRRSRPDGLCVVPCTVSHLHSASETQNGFTVGETELNMVSLVGIVRRVTSSMSSLLFLLDDMTGRPIGARFWHDCEEDGVKNSVIPPGTYVKVIGRLRSFENHRSVVGLKLRRLQDFNEITSHILEVIQAHMRNRRAPLNKVIETTSSSNRSELHPSVMKVEGVPLDPDSGGFNPIQTEVFNLVKGCSDHEGLSLLAVRNCVKPQYASRVEECLQFLKDEGHIYSTVDDDHFKTTYD